MTQRSPKRLPEKYYQRRRAAAVVVIVLVVVLLIWALTSLVGGNNEPEQDDADTAAAGQTTSLAAPAAETAESSSAPATTSAAASSSVSAEKDEDGDTESPYPDAPESSAPERSTEPSVRVDEDRTSCALNDLVITAASDQATYPAEAQPTFYMTVANPTAADCEIDLDEDNLRFEVYDLATNERIWSDTDCFEPVESGEQTFESGSERYFEAVWSRRASAPGQCNTRPAVSSGSYFLHAVVGDNPSPAHTFNLA